jgi:hypothetical protein
MTSLEQGYTAPLLDLESFREEVAYHPWHFWGLQGDKVPLNSACNSVVPQYAWQDVDAAGRFEIASALMMGEERLRELLGYRIGPRYIEKTLTWPELFNSYFKRWGYSRIDNAWVSIQLPNDGQVIGVGVEQLTAIALATAITPHDNNLDGLNESFSTAAIPTTVTDPSQIVVYFSAADRFTGEPVSDKWRIQPVQVTISGGFVTIQGRYYECVQPILYESLTNVVRDASNAANYITTIDVYQRTLNANGTTQQTAQAVLTWNTAPWPQCGVPTIGAAGDPAGTATALARVAIQDAQNGVLGIGEAVYNTASGTWVSNTCLTNCRPPDLVTIRYLAGDSLDTNYRLKKKWRTVMARLGCAELMRRISSCDMSNREIYQWQLDVSRSETNAKFFVAPGDLANPLGTLKGQLYAWHVIKHEMNLQGVLA